MPASEKVERLVVVVSVSCTLVLTALAVGRQFGLLGSHGMRVIPAQPSTRVSNWDRVLDGGHRRGERGARVSVVEFADFECTACQAFARSIEPAIRQFGKDVAFVYRHFPLSYHRLAMPYAKAAECAADQDRFWQFHDLVYTKSDSMGLKSVESFAHDAGVRSISRFTDCVKSDNTEGIARDVAEARRIGLSGTPTVVVNGLKLGIVDSATVVSEIRKALEGRR